MKLKPIVASVVLLGISGPAFAAYAAGPVVHNHQQTTSQQLTAMNAKIAKMEAVLNQNNSGGFENADSWMHRITVSGLVNVDAVFSDRTPSLDDGGRFSSGHYHDLSLTDANLYVDAAVNDWVNAHMALNFGDALQRPYQEYNSPNLAGSRVLDEAYVTIGNFNSSPWYFRAGQEYVPFGHYDRHPMFFSLTQAIEMTRETVAQVGFIDAGGFHAAAYIFNGQSRRNSENGGLNVGYNGSFGNGNHFYGQVGWLHNLGDSQFINASLGTSNLSGGNLTNALEGSSGNVNAIAVDFGGNYAQFDAGVHYVTALEHFKSAELMSDTAGSGAEPWAVGIELGYSFPTMGNDSRFAIGYQHSDEAGAIGSPGSPATGAGRLVSSVAGALGVTIPALPTVAGVGLPSNRIYGQYDLNLMKNTDLGFALIYDEDNGVSDLGTGRESYTGLVRLGVKLA